MTPLQKIIYSKLPQAIGLLNGIEQGLEMCLRCAMPPDVEGMKRMVREAADLVESSQKELQQKEEKSEQ